MDLTKLGRTERVLSAAGLLAFILSFLPWYSASLGPISVSRSGWQDPSGAIDWLPMLLLFAYAVVLFLPAAGVQVNLPYLASAANRAFIGLAVSALCVLLWAIQGLTYPDWKSLTGGFESGGSAGPAWAYYVTLVIGLAALVQSYLGFTQAGGSFAQVGASFKARSEAIQQQQGQPYGAAPQQQPFGQPQQPYAQPQAPYGDQPPQPGPYGQQQPPAGS
jgi:hypothetical protein